VSAPSGNHANETMFQPKRLLILAPHTDDAELGCGGTISRLLENGVDTMVAAFSTARESLPAGMEPDTLDREFHAAMTLLGVPAERLKVYDYPVRKLSYHRQEVLEDLVRLRADFRPDMVFLPSGTDLHQDHQVLHNEGLRAFKELTVWGYELPWNHIGFTAQAFVTLEKRHVDAKLTALWAYESQLALGRPYFTREFVEGLARVRGVQIKADYAEAFEVMRVRV
jgi:LmbE family N-acetylglucosaminyl deacetylase